MRAIKKLLFFQKYLVKEKTHTHVLTEKGLLFACELKVQQETSAHERIAAMNLNLKTFFVQQFSHKFVSVDNKFIFCAVIHRAFTAAGTMCVLCTLGGLFNLLRYDFFFVVVEQNESIRLIQCFFFVAFSFSSCHLANELLNGRNERDFFFLSYIMTFNLKFLITVEEFFAVFKGCEGDHHGRAVCVTFEISRYVEEGDFQFIMTLK
jgi:hypothetical protein